MTGLANNKERDETIVFLIKMKNPVREIAKRFNLSPAGVYGVYYRRERRRIHVRHKYFRERKNNSISNRNFIARHMDKFEPLDEEGNFGMIVLE